MSALNLNEVILCGRLTADVELKQTQSGRSVISFTLAINRPRAKESAEQTADFPACVAWDKTAEFIARYFKKGDSLYIRAKVSTRNYKDKNGRTVYVTEFVASDAHFVDNKSTATQQTNSVPPQFEEIGGDEDLPF